MEKNPAEYGITFVGVDVTKINASDAVIAAGNVMPRALNPKLWASAIIIGIMIVPVTVLLENTILSIETINTIASI